MTKLSWDDKKRNKRAALFPRCVQCRVIKHPAAMGEIRCLDCEATS